MIRLAGGRVVDPAHGRDEVADLWVENGRVAPAPAGGKAHEIHDVSGKIVMAGAIDIHSHIAGANVNLSRLLLPELRGARAADEGAPGVGFTAHETGCLYARMGFTTVIEPAITPHTALQAHFELSDIPIIDKGILVVLGNDDFLLSQLRRKEKPAVIADYVGAMIAASRALGVKVINAGGAMAFKHNVRSFGLDDMVPDYGVASRDIVLALQDAVGALGVPHPLHIHCNNLGAAGNVDTAVATVRAVDGAPAHLAHAQFYSYGKEGERGFSSAAPRLAEAVNGAANVTIDVGQVMFGQTVTVSCDVLRQFEAMRFASPRKSVILDGDSNGGGIVPIDYRRSSFVNAVQWAAGLELFLLIDDPGRVFFTTDHPNGAPFTAYPDLFALLMDREARARWMEKLPSAALAMTTLPSIRREYTLTDIATMTRAAPARLLGLTDRGHLAPGAVADIAVYDDMADKAAMFGAAHLVLKDGAVVVREGEVTRLTAGATLHVDPPVDRAMERRLDRYYDEAYGLRRAMFGVPRAADDLLGRFGEVPCRA